MPDAVKNNSATHITENQAALKEKQTFTHKYIPHEESKRNQEIILKKYAKAFEMLKNA